MQTRPGNQRRKPLHELQRAQDQMRRAVAPRCLQLQLDLPGGIDLHPFVGKGVHLISVSKVTVRFPSNGAGMGR